MVGAMLISSSSFADPYSCPYLFSDSLSLSNLKNVKSSGDSGFYRNVIAKKQLWRTGSLDLSSSFTDAWYEWRLSAKMLSRIAYRYSRKQRKLGNHLSIVDELGGQYEDSFIDVKKQIQNYFTFKAVRTVLNQLYEMNPTEYTWFYNYIANNKPGDRKHFLRALGKERQELAERVMITRLNLYAKWIKKCDHAEIYEEISDQNLELMRERLLETIVWPSDDTNTEKIG